MPIVSNAIENAKADIDRLSTQIAAWAKDFLELLDNVKHLDLVFSEAEGMDINYIGLCDWHDCSSVLVIQTLPTNATKEQRQMALAITSVITSVLFQYGHPEVAVALLGETSGMMFHHETIGARCKTTIGCSRIPEAESQFNFSCIPGHICRTASHITLN